MKKTFFVLSALLAAVTAEASWYWPFADDEKEPPRIAEILEPASTNIDAAADFMADGKTAEALKSYRRALAELDRIEIVHAARVDQPEFASVRTKRAYVSAAIDAIETQRARGNARAVVTTDTTELELAMKLEKRMKADIEKADRIAAKARVRRTTSVTNRVEEFTSDGHARTRLVVSNQTVVVTNRVACENALALFGRLASEIDALTAEREDRTAQPYFAFLEGVRGHANSMSNALATCSTKVTDEKAEKATEEKKNTRDEGPKMSDQAADYKSKVKEIVRKQKTRGEAARSAKESAERIKKEIEDNPRSRRARLLRAGQALREKNYDGAQLEIDELLKKDANDASALNLLAAMAAAQKNFGEAERRYLKVIERAPDDYHAYYNLARLRLGPLDDRKGAKQAYDDGRRFAGGPKDKKIEEKLK